MLQWLWTFSLLLFRMLHLRCIFSWFCCDFLCVSSDDVTVSVTIAVPVAVVVVTDVTPRSNLTRICCR